MLMHAFRTLSFAAALAFEAVHLVPRYPKKFAAKPEGSDFSFWRERPAFVIGNYH
ncbi:hypothetical protein [Sinorhizobium meliloti]|uniref:hypothetical protein n=1 Tax=Rhizobium meliloti TaxID=382 RepID=UPI0013E33DA6|nr:hypothetical protein [Sinorhizobium meliloti]